MCFFHDVIVQRECILVKRVIFYWMGLQMFSEIASVDIFRYWHKVSYMLSRDWKTTHHSDCKASMSIYIFLFHLNFQIIEVSANKIPLSSRWNIILYIKNIMLCLTWNPLKESGSCNTVITKDSNNSAMDIPVST